MAAPGGTPGMARREGTYIRGRRRVIVGPPQAWLPPLIFGVILAVLAALNLVTLGHCLGGEYLMFGVVLLLIGTGLGLATHPYALVVLDATAAVPIIVGIVLLAHSASC